MIEDDDFYGLGILCMLAASGTALAADLANMPGLYWVTGILFVGSLILCGWFG
jgi:hypothetical protein